ncbi:MAG: site-2 protease family protein [Candidatus ainarchaeum sp.]|nr:site-2 protease family protein [Candidatus ainarchaeum sp.]
MMILLLIVAIALGLFYATLQFSIPGSWKFGLVVLEMVLVSQVLIRLYKVPSELGMLLVKSKKGIEAIEAMAKRTSLFNFMADTGNAMCYGLLSVVLMRKGSSVASVAAGLAILAFLTFLVAPSAFIFLFQVLNLGGIDKSVSSMAGGGNIGLIAVCGILLLGGLFLFMLAGIVLYGAIVFAALVKTLILGTNAMATTAAGGTFLLPGINLPFFEGIIALAVVLVVHEGAHAVLTRIARVPLLSSGIAFFGIIPIGAFVEPDEKKLVKLDTPRQTRVLVAGATANFLTSCVAFVLFAVVVLLARTFGLMETGLAGAVMFIYTTLGLTFALNFVVGTVNLLPIPLFDGYRILDINVKNKMVVKAVMYVSIAFFILNFLPLLFHA